MMMPLALAVEPERTNLETSSSKRRSTKVARPAKTEGLLVTTRRRPSRLEAGGNRRTCHRDWQCASLFPAPGHDTDGTDRVPVWRRLAVC